MSRTLQTHSARLIAQAGVIASAYAALTFLVLQFEGVFAWGIVQFRVSEALTVLACVTPAAVPGLTIGTALANLSSVGSAGLVGLLDVVFGSLGTLLGAAWSWRFRRTTPLALAGPVIFNALIVPAYLPLMLRVVLKPTDTLFGVSIASEWWVIYLFGVAAVGLGEAAVVYGIGWPLLTALRRLRLPGLAEQ